MQLVSAKQEYGARIHTRKHSNTATHTYIYTCRSKPPTSRVTLRVYRCLEGCRPLAIRGTAAPAWRAAPWSPLGSRGQSALRVARRQVRRAKPLGIAPCARAGRGVESIVGRARGHRAGTARRVPRLRGRAGGRRGKAAFSGKSRDRVCGCRCVGAAEGVWVANAVHPLAPWCGCSPSLHI